MRGDGVGRHARRRRTRRRVRLARTAVVAVLLVGSAWALGSAWVVGGGRAPNRGAVTPQAEPSSGPPPETTIELAFAGDVHFAGSSARALTEGLGAAANPLREADLAVVNLETAVTDGGTPAPKQYVFRAPAKAFDVLADAGVDAVTLANNHGLDYGREGLADTLEAADAAGIPVLGAGVDASAAWEPLRAVVSGLRVSVVAATDVLDAFATGSEPGSWLAGPTTSGLASSKDETRLLQVVREERDSADVLVVYLHWGAELQECPTERQRELAAELAAAGVDLVVGGHAHVPQGGEWIGDTWVQYGLGNYVFYARRDSTRQSGVLTVEADADGVRDVRWHPATIVDGLPEPDGAPSAPLEVTCSA